MTPRSSIRLSHLPHRLRHGLAASAARRVGVLTAVVAFLTVSWTGLLVLDNTYGPLEDATGAATPIALAVGALVAVGAHQAVVRLAQRSAAAVAVLLVLLGVAGAVLLPRPIDVHESFVEQPNERWWCTGWSFRYYPPETFDASSTTYCVGLESPRPTG